MSRALAGRFEIIRQIGQGESGVVHLARDSWRGRCLVALKVLARPSQERIEAFEIEYARARRLRHPGMATVRDLGVWDDHGALWLSSDYVDGVAIDAWASESDAQPLARLLAFVARTLAYVHASGLVHGDIKPAHILVSSHDPEHARLVDLGLAAASEQPGSRIAGTPGYLAPEVLRGCGRSTASDVFALAMSAAVALGAEPVGLEDGATASASAWELVIDRLLATVGALAPALRPALALDPQDRPTAAELADALDTGAGRSIPLADEFVGRAGELTRLEQALAAAELGGPRVLIVEGPAGLGKSRLVDELTTTVQLHGGTVLGSERQDWRDPLDTVMGQLAQIGLGAGERASQDDVGATSEAALGAVRRAAAAGLCLVWLDDVGAQDRLARRFTTRVIGEVEARRFETAASAEPWLLCITTRAATGLFGADIEPELRLRLEPLTLEQSQRFLDRAVAPRRLDAVESERVHDLAGGVPELIVGVARALHEGDDDQAVPADVNALLDMRTSVLSDAELDELYAAACFEQPTPLRLVAAAKLGRAKLEPSRLVELGLLQVTPRRDESAAWVAGALLRTRLRAAQSPADLAARHAGVVEALRIDPALRAGDATLREQLGRHLLGAGELDAGASLLLDCATSAVTDPRLARRILGRLLKAAPAWPRTAEARRLAARLDLELGDPATAVELLGALSEIGAAAPTDLLLSARAAAELGAYARALELVQQAVASGVELDVESIDLEARLFVYLGHYERARDSATAALGPDLEPAARGRLRNVLGLAALYTGDLDEAVCQLEQAVSDAQATGQRRLIASVQNSLALALQKRGDAHGAAAMYTASLAHVRALGDRSREASRLLNLGTLRQDAGDWDEAFEMYRAGLAMAARQRSGREVVRIGYNLANLLVRVGSLPEAERVAARARAEAERLAMSVEAAFCCVLQAEISNARLDPRGALGWLGEADRLAPSGRAALLKRDAALQKGWAALSNGELERARHAMEAVENVDDAEMQLLAASLAAASGDGALARERLARVEALSTSAADSDARWRGLALAARLASGDGDATGETRLALDAYEELLARLPRVYRSKYAGVPRVAALVQEMLTRLAARATGSTPETGTVGAAGTTVTRLHRVLQINRRLGRQLELRPLLELILDEAIDLAQAERGFVLLAEDSKLVVAAARHLDLETLRKPESKLSHSLARQVIDTGESIVTVDAMDDHRFREQLSVSSLKLRSIVCVPLVIDGQSDGALYLDNRFRKNAFSEELVDVLRAFAVQASIAIGQARLRATLLERQRELEASREELARLNEKLQSRVNETAERLSEATELLHSERDENQLRYRYSGIVGRSRPMVQVLALVDRLSQTDFPVFVHGESGTGKELVARAMHTTSGRAEGPFVAVNCAAIPETLLESELFGHKRGAFTGASSDRRGLLSLADRGTLFLDEVGDMARPMQAKLLRVLEEKAYRQLGGETLLTTDVRVISASNKDLGELVQDNRFREDLFYRLNAATVRLPPLRDRVEDIPELVAHLLDRARKESHRDELPRVTPAALNALMAYRWPGNVRELDNELRRATALANHQIDIGHLSERVVSLVAAAAPRRQEGGMFRAAIADLERRLIIAAMQGCDWNAALAAQSLGLSRSVFYAKLKRYDIRRSPPESRRRKVSSSRRR